jgi:membrane-bound inhibitor of C-type lysozyme
VNGAGNSLVIVPIEGSSIIFANVMSGSGARYAAAQYIWWDAQGAVNFYSDSLSGKMQSTCRRMNAA